MSRTVTAFGYSVAVAVQAGQLVVRDGSGSQRRERRYSRVEWSGYAGLTRLLLVGGGGSVTLSAVRWLDQVDASLVHMDTTGRVLLVSGDPPGSQPALRRAQAVAGLEGSPVGLEVARMLVRERIEGQAQVAVEQLEDDGLAEQLDSLLGRVARARSIDSLRSTEATAAKLYWAAWEPLPVTFEEFGSRLHIPDHWRSFGPRWSPLTRSPRGAVTPAGALLNFALGLMKAEAHIATEATGMDAAIGVLHADRPWRNSMACDVLEPARHAVEAWTLALLRKRSFRPVEFHEDGRGACRLGETLAKWLATTAEQWREHVVPVAERVAAMLAVEATPTWHSPSGFRRGRKQPPKTPPLPTRCRRCSGLVTTPVPRGRRGLCEACRPKCRLCGGPVGARRVICQGCDEARTCAHCQASLAGRSHAARFCGKRCRDRFVRAARRAKLSGRVCTGCAVPLESHRRSSARFCDHKCRKRWARRTDKEDGLGQRR